MSDALVTVGTVRNHKTLLLQHLVYIPYVWTKRGGIHAEAGPDTDEGEGQSPGFWVVYLPTEEATRCPGWSVDDGPTLLERLRSIESEAFAAAQAKSFALCDRALTPLEEDLGHEDSVLVKTDIEKTPVKVSKKR